jgi:glycosyltransferase involved in cell wall biosynthesis
MALKISIIVPAFNEEKLMAESLASVNAARAELSLRGVQSELIVCDNNSTDRTSELARAAGAQVVFEPVNQIGRARNRGASVASGDWLLFVDADSRPGAALFGDVVDAVKSGKYVAGGSTLKLDGNSRTAAAVATFWNCVSRSGKMLAGSFIFCEASVFRKAGGFDETLFAAEELDLTKRLKHMGRAEGKKLVILHKHPLVTSSRKLQLYSWREHLGFLWKTLTSWKASLKSREACGMWYDGRR